MQSRSALLLHSSIFDAGSQDKLLMMSSRDIDRLYWREALLPPPRPKQPDDSLYFWRAYATLNDDFRAPRHSLASAGPARLPADDIRLSDGCERNSRELGLIHGMPLPGCFDFIAADKAASI